MDSPVAGVKRRRPVAVVVAAVICFAAAAFAGVNMLVGLGIAALGAENKGLHNSSNLLLLVGLVIAGFTLALGILYLLGGLGLLRGSRRWYLAVLVMFCLTLVGVVVAVVFQGNTWDLVVPLANAVGLLVLATRRSRAYFAKPAPQDSSRPTSTGYV